MEKETDLTLSTVDVLYDVQRTKIWSIFYCILEDLVSETAQFGIPRFKDFLDCVDVIEGYLIIWASITLTVNSQLFNICHILF